ncbi:VPS62 [Candida jiufengensis]|uniref:VPS62 n=1 Tax=Candida jiufengensis TaxID=497108 RepID=UPI002224222E|nr:VPS62 [Candida jiufengensis]KAI5950499.1 VPS62 [Candida jiufengensis]
MFDIKFKIAIETLLSIETHNVAEITNDFIANTITVTQPIEQSQENTYSKQPQQSYFDISEGNNYILNTIQDDYKELKISNILPDPIKYKNLPPIISLPSQEQRTLKPGEISQYVIDYSPLVYLYSEEKYLPYDIKEFVTNFHVTYKNGTIYPGTETVLLAAINADGIINTHLIDHEELSAISDTDLSENSFWFTFKNFCVESVQLMGLLVDQKYHLISEESPLLNVPGILQDTTLNKLGFIFLPSSVVKFNPINKFSDMVVDRSFRNSESKEPSDMITDILSSISKEDISEMINTCAKELAAYNC